VTEIPCPAFISEQEWAQLDDGTRLTWHNFARDVGWLMDQPQFRRFAFTMLNDPRFFGTDHSPVRATERETFHAIGVQDAGRAMRLVLQSANPRMWMKTMHEAFNGLNLPNMPPESGKR
jgi:hypothetical protein